MTIRVPAKLKDQASLVKVPDVANTRMGDLSPEHIAAVDVRLNAGEPAAKVAEAVHAWGYFTDLKPDSLKKMLERYRKRVLAKRAQLGVLEALKNRETTTVVSMLNAMTEMALLAQAQRDRFYKALKNEEKMPLLLNSVYQEARLYKEMLAELGKLQLEAGIIPRAPRRVSGSAVDPMTGEVRVYSWTEEYEEVFHTLETILDGVPAN